MFLLKEGLSNPCLCFCNEEIKNQSRRKIIMAIVQGAQEFDIS